MTDPIETLAALLPACLEARAPLLTPRDERAEAKDSAPGEHRSAFCAFNGFGEGLPQLVLEVYGRSLLIHDHSPDPEGDRSLAEAALAQVTEAYPWIDCALWKVRRATEIGKRNGRMLLGDKGLLCRKIEEDGVGYALALGASRDSSFYLDTRALRAWARRELAGKRVLNTFAHTGSLGVAARAAPAARVLHTDLRREFLNLAKVSYGINHWPVDRADFRTGDFFEVVSKLRHSGQLFDCVLLDPPFFSVTEKGRVDLENALLKIINKVRPLVAHEGRLVVVNNGVFVSGQAFEAQLEGLCEDAYLSRGERLPIPPDIAGFEETRRELAFTDPAPYNHSTKIAVINVTRKDGRTN